LILTLTLCFALASCGCAEPSPVERAVSVGTHSLHVRALGGGPPTVVVDVGLGGSLEEWHPLQEALAADALVVIYDRAGYGGSEAGPLPRDSGREADELRAVLDAAGVPGPFVLVGHSLGALNAQVFHGRYPEDTAGLVLLDPPPLGWILGDGYPGLREIADGMTDEWQGIADRLAGSDDPGERAEEAFLRTIASEHREMFGESARLAGAIESFGDTPVVVVASGVANPAFGDVAEEYQAYWADESRAIAAKSTRGEFVLAERSTHMLHRDAADLVMASIRSVVTQVIPEE
jgi:pimeloyl-ACP methyl ester carboxylesterase